MRRATRLRLLAFLLIGAVAVVHAGVRYAGLGSLVRSDSYEVTVRLADSGGLFDRAEVTYRGVTVGRVTDVRFRRDGVDAVLAIERDRRIPSDLAVEVHNRSAVGEQYIDLVPASTGAPYLAAGDVVQESVTSTPIDENDLLVSIDRFVRSVDTDDLATVIDETGIAFEGVGDDLQRLIDGGAALVDAAARSLPATRELLQSGRVVLETQDDQAQLISGYLGDLAGVSGVLSDQDGDLRVILRDGSLAAGQLKILADDLAPSLEPLLADLVDLGDIAYRRQDGIEETLVALPWALASAQTPGREGRAHFGLALAQDPAVCQEGYVPVSEWRAARDTTHVPAPDSLGCDEAAPSVPRGSPAVIGRTGAGDLGRSAAMGSTSGSSRSWRTMFTVPLLGD
ncbi:ABC transporter substrate-binding protein [Aeromicrobium sp. A1-2]|uniref:MCE family protein n=1 Tax=Aeromicrobium sp. A1-2 TaxID=2107713 RepID=UPI000E4CAD39|nr:MlaD family protein [Aeromicrobium sp. A1-2]AXT83933.1 ABC transporter substrate-binding protein [Aeromicrobium sp. A1-2]